MPSTHRSTRKKKVAKPLTNGTKPLAFNVAAARKAASVVANDCTVPIADDQGHAYDPPVTMTFVSSDTPEFRSAQSKAWQSVQGTNPIDDKADESAVLAWDFAYSREILAHTVKAWTGLQEDGTAVPVTVENARVFFAFRHIREQAMRGVGDTPAATFRALAQRNGTDRDAG